MTCWRLPRSAAYHLANSEIRYRKETKPGPPTRPEGAPDAQDAHRVYHGWSARHRSQLRHDRYGGPAHNPGGPCLQDRTRTSASQASRATTTSSRRLIGSSGRATGWSPSLPPGTSGEGRELLYATVGDGPTTFWLQARIHGNELHSTEAALQILDLWPAATRLARLIREQPHRRRHPDVQPRRRRGQHPPEHDPEPDRPQPGLGELRPAGVGRVLEAVARRCAASSPSTCTTWGGAGRQRHQRPQPVPDRCPVDRPGPDDRRAVADQPADGDGERRRPRPVRPGQRRALPAHRHHQRCAEPDADGRNRTRRRAAGHADAHAGARSSTRCGRSARRATASSRTCSGSRRWRCSPRPPTAL